MMTNRLSILCVALVALACTEPDEIVRGHGPYLNQIQPTTEAVIFAPGLVSVEGRYEYALSIHPDGDRVLFTVEIPKKGASVHCSSFSGGSWTQPVPIALSEGAMKSEMEAFFSPDGERVFFAPYSKGMDVRIWSAEVTPDGFQHPRPLGEPVSRDPSFYPVQATNGALYYTNLAKRTVFRAELEDGEVCFTESAGLECGGHAFPSPDGTFILLDSAALDSDEQRDIFVAFLKDDGSWSRPRALGPAVNTEYSETCPSLSPDGRFLFFSRYNEPARLSNIYWVSTEVIKAVSPA